MSLVLLDRVRETTTTTGSGTLTLDGAVTGFQGFSALGNGNTTYYTIQGTTQWEVGIGTYTAGTLSRDTVISSSAGGSKLTLTDGTKDVFVTLPAEKTITSIASADASIIVTTVGSLVDLSVSQTSPASVLVERVRNSTGATLTKGTAVYISGATGQLPTVSKALATSDATSAQTLGLITSDLANNSNGYVTIIGLVDDLDTSAYTDGVQLYLSPTTAGTLTATKPYAPQHLVYVAVVAHAHPVHGKLIVKVQNGYEMDELHNVSAQNPNNGDILVYNTSTALWETSANATGTVTSVSGTSPVASSGGAAPVISLSSAYGDTLNPYAVKTAKYFLAAPNGADGVPVFRLIVASDIPTLNQNTTGTASNVTGTVAVVNGGTGGTTAADARTNLTAAKSGANTDITSVGLTTGTISTAPSAATDIVNKTYADGLTAKWGA